MDDGGNKFSDFCNINNELNHNEQCVVKVSPNSEPEQFHLLGTLIGFSVCWLTEKCSSL